MMTHQEIDATGRELFRWSLDADVVLLPTGSVRTSVRFGCVSDVTPLLDLTGRLSDEVFELFCRSVRFCRPDRDGAICVAGVTAPHDPLHYVFDKKRVVRGRLGGYSWMVGLAPWMVEELGGIGRVVAAAPVADVVPVMTPEGVFVVCRTASQPLAWAEPQWAAWREFLLPVLPAKVCVAPNWWRIENLVFSLADADRPTEQDRQAWIDAGCPQW